jgi:outer membrane lipoprotein-sorting protein
MLKMNFIDLKRVLAVAVIFSISFILFFGKIAKAAKPDSLKTQAIQILKKYNKSAAVEIKTTKTEEKKALGTSLSSDGILIYSKNKINFTSIKPTATEIIYNKNVWIIESPDLELDEKAGRKVTMLDSNKVTFIKTIADLFSANEKFFTKDTVLPEFKTYYYRVR